MPALKPTKFSAKIVWLGQVAPAGKDLSATSVETLSLVIGGAEGEAHSGITRPSCVRVKALYEKGTEIANVRQLSVLSKEELDLIAQDMGLAALDPAWLGASIVLEGIPDFTHVPPNARLQGPDGATITIDMENRPCVLPGRVIEGSHPGHGPKFKTAAEGRRGVTAWVERPGQFAVGDVVQLFVPDQPVWAHLDEARA
ncbi:MOSC domain-containing protein [Shimia sp. MMG029]|uniref:MOSC domain-containing protein n=1 Tax=Shimia sp. MMG029 TaxID=3021978 RepID=UPI0022FF1CE4|nr:MOSC domain-containing protein [Shimia sp. MMG029]MDA5556963.1 MOSC domain-containing protein [Shimia sp. MMG029]